MASTDVRADEPWHMTINPLLMPCRTLLSLVINISQGRGREGDRERRVSSFKVELGKIIVFFLVSHFYIFYWNIFFKKIERGSDDPFDLTLPTVMRGVAKGTCWRFRSYYLSMSSNITPLNNTFPWIICEGQIEIISLIL